MSRVGILCKFIKQVGPNLKQVGLLLVEFQKIVPNKRVGWKICYLLEWKKCKNDNRVYSFIRHPRVPLNNLSSSRVPNVSMYCFSDFERDNIFSYLYFFEELTANHSTFQGKSTRTFVFFLNLI